MRIKNLFQFYLPVQLVKVQMYKTSNVHESTYVNIGRRRPPRRKGEEHTIKIVCISQSSID